MAYKESVEEEVDDEEIIERDEEETIEIDKEEIVDMDVDEEEADEEEIVGRAVDPATVYVFPTRIHQR